jgi:hypothetical protein
VATTLHQRSSLADDLGADQGDATPIAAGSLAATAVVQSL